VVFMSLIKKGGGHRLLFCGEVVWLFGGGGHKRIEGPGTQEHRAQTALR
jgi:hypothetical protein